MAKYIGTGTTVEYDKDQAQDTPVGTPEWTALTCVVSIQPAGVEFSTVEAPLCLSDVSSDVAESAASDPVSDEVPFTILLDLTSTDTEMEDLEALAVGRWSVPWRITFPAASSRVQNFDGYLRSFKPQPITRQEYAAADGVIVRTGAITYT